MRTLIRKECTYDEYGEMIDHVDEHMPFALLEARYNRRLATAILTFWDSDYIPGEWDQWVVRPKSTASKTEGVSEEYEKKD